MLKKYYDVAVDIEGKEFIKIELDWDYNKWLVHLLIQPYLQKAMQQFDDLTSSKQHDAPYPHTPLQFGIKQQFAEYDSSAPVGAVEQKYIQKVIGKFLWYARGIDGTLLTALSSLAAQQSQPMSSTMACIKQFLDYCATQEPAILPYHKSDMVLAVHSDAFTSMKRMHAAE